MPDNIQRCFLCGIRNPTYDASWSPAELLEPGRESVFITYGESSKPEDLRCLHCYVGYPPFKDDGVTPWWEDGTRLYTEAIARELHQQEITVTLTLRDWLRIQSLLSIAPDRYSGRTMQMAEDLCKRYSKALQKARGFEN